MSNEVAALMLPDNPSADLKSYWAQLQAESEQMQNHVHVLRNVIDAPPYDSMRISKEALGIYDESITVNKLRKHNPKDSQTIILI